MKIRCSIDFLLNKSCVAAYALALSTPLFAAPEVVMLDRIVAIVNDEVITRQDLDRRVNLTVKQLESRNAALPSAAELEKQLLERMINDRAQLQYAKETGIRVDDTQLEKTLQRVAQDNKMTLAEFREALEKDGIKFSQFREEIRNEITLARVKEREVDSKMVIAESEVDNFFECSGNAEKSDRRVSSSTSSRPGSGRRKRGRRRGQARAC